MPKKPRIGLMKTFDLMQKEIRKNPSSDEITSYFQTLANDALTYLSENAQIEELNTKITGKEYFSYRIDKTKSRSINKALFSDINIVNRFLDLLKADDVRGNINSDDITSACYTTIMSLASYIDLTNKGDQKTPGTFFEYLVIHMLTRHFKTKPSDSVKVDIGEDKPGLQPLLADRIGLGDGVATDDVATTAREEVDDLVTKEGVVLDDQDFISHE